SIAQLAPVRSLHCRGLLEFIKSLAERRLAPHFRPPENLVRLSTAPSVRLNVKSGACAPFHIPSRRYLRKTKMSHQILSRSFRSPSARTAWSPRRAAVLMLPIAPAAAFLPAAHAANLTWD